jgi:hypothetical protein
MSGVGEGGDGVGEGEVLGAGVVCVLRGEDWTGV